MWPEMFKRFPVLPAFLALSVLLVACGPSKTPAPYTHYGLHGGADSAGVHTVSKGDTVWNISQRYEVVMQDIIYVNDLRPPYALAVGQRLTLPPPQTYKVRAGDNLYAISRTFNISQTELARMNRMKAPYIIQPGDKLRLPSVAGRVYREPAESRNVASRTVTPSKRKASAKIASQVAKKTPRRAGSRFMWPVDGPVISSYGAKSGGLHNDGINIKARRGSNVASAENGIVVYTGRDLEGFGNLVLVRHADRWMTAYAHLDRIKVSKGDRVKQGQMIGTVGSTGGVSSPQLHFEIRRGTKALDPKKYLGSQKS